jgi:hypothetical protein
MIVKVHILVGLHGRQALKADMQEMLGAAAAYVLRETGAKSVLIGSRFCRLSKCTLHVFALSHAASGSCRLWSGKEYGELGSLI